MKVNKEEMYKKQYYKLSEALDTQTTRAIMEAEDKGASGWLTSRPLNASDMLTDKSSETVVHSGILGRPQVCLRYVAVGHRMTQTSYCHAREEAM